MTGRTGVEGCTRVADGFFERGKVLVVRESVIQNGCNTLLNKRTQVVFGR